MLITTRMTQASIRETARSLRELQMLEAALKDRGLKKPALPAQANRAYINFKRQYRGDPVAFVWDCFDWEQTNRDVKGPAPYQEEILGALLEHKRVSARGPRGL